MRTAKTISITLPPELLAQAQEIAKREHRTMSELFREALRRYPKPDKEWDELMAWGLEHGKTLGIKSEEDVERMSDEWRAERRLAAQR
jgi:Arc/MetJ-type ribon-helix-helix transcriptional regulator